MPHLVSMFSSRSCPFIYNTRDHHIIRHQLPTTTPSPLSLKFHFLLNVLGVLSRILVLIPVLFFLMRPSSAKYWWLFHYLFVKHESLSSTLRVLNFIYWMCLPRFWRWLGINHKIVQDCWEWTQEIWISGQSHICWGETAEINAKDTTWYAIESYIGYARLNMACASFKEILTREVRDRLSKKVVAENACTSIPHTLVGQACFYMVTLKTYLQT